MIYRSQLLAVTGLSDGKSGIPILQHKYSTSRYLKPTVNVKFTSSNSLSIACHN